MSITCLPQGSSRPTHKSLLLRHRWDKTGQFPNPCPRTPLPSTPHPLVTEVSLPLRAPSPHSVTVAWLPGLVWATPALSPQAKCSGILLLQGWGLGARGAHVYGGACSVQGCTHVRPAPPLPVPHLRRLRVKSRKKGHRKKRSLYVVCTRLGHTKLRWPRNTVEAYKANAEWLLRTTPTIWTPRCSPASQLKIHLYLIHASIPREKNLGSF